MTDAPQRIMALGDVHGNLRFFIAAVAVAQRDNVDVICQVGDFGIWTHTAVGRLFLDNAERVLDTTGITLIFCDGNHENFDHLYDIGVDDDGFRRVRPHIWHAPRGHTWTMTGVRFGAFGGAHSIDGPGGIWTQARGPGNHWWPQESITQEDVERALTRGPVDVMISHEVPEGVAIPGITESYPLGAVQRGYVRSVIDAWTPQVAFCGHYHLRHSQVISTGESRDHDTRVEILAHDMSRHGQYLLADLDPFTLLLEA